MAEKTLTTDYRVEPLGPHHDRAAFSCGNPELDRYLRQQAGQDSKRKLATAFVATADGKSVAGFYTLSAESILASDLPAKFGKKLPRFPLPVTLLGRMAVAQSLQGQGLGAFLLIDALARASKASQQVASWAVVVDTKAGARDFYLKHGFIPVDVDSVRLFYPMKTVEKVV